MNLKSTATNGFNFQINNKFINPLSPDIHLQILQTDLHTFPLRMSRENLIKDQRFFSLRSFYQFS